MNGGRMTTSRFAIAAAVSALMGTAAMGGSASAADLGGNCCADLEERIAELEATTVRKGNRKVSLTISGFVGHAVMWWDDGTQSDMYIGDTGNLTSRFRLRGEAKINPELSAGFLYEFAATANSLGSANQLNGGDDLGQTAGCNASTGVLPGTNNNSGCVHLRDSTVWLRHVRLGMVKVGFGSTATDNLVLIDLGGMGVAGTPDVALHNGGFILRSNAGLLAGATSVNWAAAIRGHESWDTNRRNHVLYETPTLHGFTLQAAVAEDNFWDIALRYAAEFNGVRIAAGIGYMEDSEFNATHQLLVQNGALCVQNCNVKSSEWKGALSIMHVPTGLFITGSAGKRELEGSQAGTAATQYRGPDGEYWHIAGGIAKNFFGIGNTVLFAEYGEHSGHLAQQAFLTASTNFNNCTVAGSSCKSDVTNWGLGLTQYIDSAAMELFATYKNYSLDANGFIGASATLNKGVGGTSDMQLFMVGTKLNF